MHNTETHELRGDDSRRSRVALTLLNWDRLLPWSCYERTSNCAESVQMASLWRHRHAYIRKQIEQLIIDGSIIPGSRDWYMLHAKQRNDITNYTLIPHRANVPYMGALNRWGGIRASPCPISELFQRSIQNHPTDGVTHHLCKTLICTNDRNETGTTCVRKVLL